METPMDDLRLLDAVERYIKGEMHPDERVQFEQLRKTNAEVDQLVVEHTFFPSANEPFWRMETFQVTSQRSSYGSGRTRTNQFSSLARKGKSYLPLEQI